MMFGWMFICCFSIGPRGPVGPSSPTAEVYLQRVVIPVSRSSLTGALFLQLQIYLYNHLLQRGSQIDNGVITENAFLRGRGVISCIQKMCRHTSLQWQMCYFLRAVDPVVAEGLFPVHRGIANRKALSRQRLLDNVGSGGVADDVLYFDDVPPDLSCEDLEHTFPRFSSLEGLGEYRV
ncbi:uncharacterized protein DS421_15g503930 [Arachis hypogaea]|nr:uncharacterized protein DS421_15g503930 [Arachis hypogaea]